ncbi:MAG: bifunctional phosphopantothenoylcysteine decarboxylase/phosphopantothenate--cysteine ligase CoaBC [Betaproteobacteria bacterium]|nr:MAG: bifunctional phosphopantothenoylcysteine decarboxylase/phosphopantothenate--cysteine ligase CoaBC [Betaproteobacteria bacterium]
MANISRKQIVLGITGGIAAYKAAELPRELQRKGFDVQVVMTRAAGSLVTPATFQALSGKPVFSDLWDPRIADNMGHIELSRGKEAIVVAPATADFLAKIANGLADDLLSTLCLARECPLLVAPAMNRQMWDNPATRRNVERLLRDGVNILGPGRGDQACGEVGLGRMLEPQEIAEAVVMQLSPKLLRGVQVLITAGPTFEPIDAVRGITNRSSGKMGYAVARAALDAGAKVSLITGPVTLPAPAGAEITHVETTAQMFDAVKRQAARANIYIGVAAVADYRVDKPRAHKIKKTDERQLQLRLVPNPDILAWVAGRPKPPFCVGFAAESRNLDAYADAKRRRKKVDMMVANLAQDAIGSDENEVTVLDDRGKHRFERAPKDAVARQLIAHIAQLYAKKKKRTS